MVDTNPFQAPSSELRESALPGGSPLIAIIVGVVIDVGGTVVLGFVMLIAYTIRQLSQGATQEQVIQSLQTVDPTSWFFLLSAGLGTLLSFLGGYVCAAIVRRNELKCASVVGLISFAFGIWAGAGRIVAWLTLAMALMSLAAVLSGAWVNARRRS